MLRFNPGRAGSIIAAPKELADPISQLSQRRVFAFVDWFYHGCSISEYDMRATLLALEPFRNDGNISSDGQQSVIDKKKTVDLDAESYPVRQTSKSKLKQIDFRFEGRAMYPLVR